MKIVQTQDAIGCVLCHDITKIVQGVFKGRLFKKGHIITEADIPELLKVGKDHLYVWEQSEWLLHEDEAAQRLACAIAGENIVFNEPSEGKINLTASSNGLLKVDVGLLAGINSVEHVVVATRHNNSLVRQGDVVAGTRVIPLVVDKKQIITVEELCQSSPVVVLKPLKMFRIGLVITGNEVFYERIPDSFGPVLTEKMNLLGSEIVDKIYVPDDINQITSAIKGLLSRGVDMILVSGGMSVDPDDLTPGAIRAAGADVVGYGAPVLPGSMFMIGYFAEVPILGLPGCEMYSKTTLFD